MLRVTSDVQGPCFLVGLLLILMSVPLSALAELKRLATPGLDTELVPRRVRGELIRIRQTPFQCSGAAREWQLCGKDGRLLAVGKEKHKANSVDARLAEARIEGPHERRSVAVTRRIPTIQLLDCTT